MDRLDRALDALRQEANRADDAAEARVTEAALGRLGGIPVANTVASRLPVLCACIASAVLVGALSALVEPSQAQQPAADTRPLSVSYEFSANAILSRNW